MRLNAEDPGKDPEPAAGIEETKTAVEGTPENTGEVEN